MTPSTDTSGGGPVQQSTHGSADTGVVRRVPPQPRAQDVDRERGVEAGATRGEHTHSETPIPRPRLVQRASVRGQILDALRTALVAGELTPGEVYSAPALGERFGVSATPVREAMQQLAQEGARSEERRVGKECRSRWSPDHEKKKE